MHRTIRENLTRGAGALIVAALAVAFGAASAGAEKLKSQWRNTDVAIDAQASEWEGAITRFEDEQIGVGVRNDIENLYVALIVENERTEMEMLTRGCTVWFDPKGKDGKTFGIRYPLGVTGKDRRAFARGLMESGNVDSLVAVYQALPPNIEFLAGADAPGVSAPAHDHGVEVAARAERGRLIYELKVPLTGSEPVPHAIGVQPGKAFAIGIETPERTDPPGGGPSGGGRGPGREGGMRRGGPGGGGPGGGPRGPGARERLSLWITVQLSPPPKM
jgi:hypothetical protein